MELVKTMCARDCPDACWLDVTVENGKISKVVASVENPVTAGITCPRAAGDPRRTYSEKRVLKPRIRDEMGTHSTVPWEQALESVTCKLKETIDMHGRESVLLLDYAGNTGFVTSGYSKRLWNALGVTHTDYTVCSASGHAAIYLHYGLSYGCQPQHLPVKRTIVFWGFNAKTSSPHQWALAEQARSENGAKIITVDPRMSTTSEASDLWISPKPGTDVALAYGIAHHLISNDLVDHGFIEKHTHGYDSYREEALKWAPSRVEKVTGVPLSQVEAFCNAVLDKPTVFMIGLGLNKSLTGAESCRAVSLLPALIGQHRGFYYTNSRGRYIGGDSTGWSLTSKPPKVVSMISLGRRLEAGEFKFVYVFGMNPVLTLPDSRSVLNGLSRSDVYLVVHDTHFTETTDLSDVILPAPTFLEKNDIYVSDSHPYVRIGRKAVAPLGESMEEIKLTQQIARRIGAEESWVFEDPWELMENGFSEAFEQGSFKDLMLGQGLHIRHKPMDEYPTSTGKLEFASTSVPEGISPIPVQLDVEIEDGEFIMLNSALPNYTHTQFTDVYGEIPCIAWINPADVVTHSFIPKEPATLYNDIGKFEVTLIPTRKVPKGVVWCPRELIDSNGGIQNSLSHGTPQPIGGGPMFNTIKVKIKQ